MQGKNGMEEKKPFAMRAARWSVILPLGTIAVNFIINGFQGVPPRGFILVLGIVYLFVYLFGIILAIVALRGMKSHGAEGIRGPAIAGLGLNVLILAFMLCWIPAMARVKSYVEQNSDPKVRAGIAILKEDAIAMQTSGTVPERTFTVEEHGSAAPVFQLMNDNMVEQSRLLQEFHVKTGHIDIASGLEAPRLLDLHAIADTRRQVLILQNAYQEFASKITEQGAATCKQVMAMPVSGAFKNGFVDGYMDKKLEEGKVLAQIKQLHFAYTESILELLSFMEAKAGVCSLKEGYLIFEDDADEEVFNSLFAKIVQSEEQINGISILAQENIQESAAYDME